MPLRNMLTCYSQPSIDVEAAIRNGTLDVGIFGPKGLLSETIAGNMFEKLREEIMDIAEA